MRATTAFNRLLALESTTVQAVRLETTEIVVVVRLATRRLRCPDCDYTTSATYDHRPSPSRWRHLDVCGRSLMLECDLRRLRCPAHGVRTQAVPFARPGARITRQFENLIVWCASSMDWTAASVLCRVAWRTVANVVERVVPSSTELSELDGLVHIGVDEISWKRGHKYLTLVIDHDSGKVIWGAKDRTAVTLDAFFDDLGETKTAAIKSVSMDFGAPYAKAVREKAPHAAICLDPFHAVALATKALDQTRRDTWRDMRGVDPDAARRFKGTRFVLLGNPENLTDRQPADAPRRRQRPRTTRTASPPTESNKAAGPSGRPTNSKKHSAASTRRPPSPSTSPSTCSTHGSTPPNSQASPHSSSSPARSNNDPRRSSTPGSGAPPTPATKEPTQPSEPCSPERTASTVPTQPSPPSTSPAAPPHPQPTPSSRLATHNYIRRTKFFRKHQNRGRIRTPRLTNWQDANSTSYKPYSEDVISPNEPTGLDEID